MLLESSAVDLIVLHFPVELITFLFFNYKTYSINYTDYIIQMSQFKLQNLAYIIFHNLIQHEFKSLLFPSNIKSSKMIPSQPQIYHPNHEIIYIHKQRPLIFTDVYNFKHKRKTFDDIYNSPVFKELSFLINDQQQACQCLNTIKECPKLKDFLKESRKHEARDIFQHLKQKVISIKKYPQLIQGSFGLSQVFQPHFQSLLSVIHVQNPEIIAQLLKHVKTDYCTFWIYGLYGSKFPSYQSLVQNIQKIVLKLNLDMDIQVLVNPNNNELKKAYDMKLFNIFKGSFPSVVNIICNGLKQNMIVEKLLICHFVKGRERKQFQVIKAVMQM